MATPEGQMWSKIEGVKKSEDQRLRKIDENKNKDHLNVLDDWAQEARQIEALKAEQSKASKDLLEHAREKGGIRRRPKTPEEGEQQIAA